MIFSSLTFLFIFFPVVTLIYFLIPKRFTKGRNAALLLASLIFYAWGEPANILLIGLCIGITYFLSFRIEKKNKTALLLGIAANLLPLFLFKYTDFFILNINTIFHSSIQKLGLSLPIGISFYTFQVITYIVDLYQGKVHLQRDPVAIALYIFLYPQLIAGPIVRYSDIESQLTNRHTTLEQAGDGLRQFIIGLSKKVIIANQAGYVVSQIQTCDTVSTGMKWISIIAYSVQILFDFSGYSDMAIGLGRIYGFSIPKNFDRPYISKSVTEFWRRWHMTLSRFFRDYVYIPLGGNHHGKLRQTVNLFIVWFLTGMWHGAFWNYILWGLYYFIILLLEKNVWGNLLKRCARWFQHIVTLFFIFLGWGIFMHETNSPADLFSYIGSLFQFSNSPVSTSSVRALGIWSGLIFTVLGLILSLLPEISASSLKDRNSSPALLFFFNIFLIFLFIISVLMLIGGSFNPFIYFRF